MFLLSFITLGLATAALTSPGKRADTLAVEISGPASVNSIDDLKFTASIKNTGAETVKLFKYSNILDNKLPTQSFIVTKDGKNVPFTGIRISVALDQLDDSAFATIPAGETLTIQHEVASSFSFASAGPGKYTFEPIAVFQTADDSLDNRITMKPVKVQATTNKFEVMITGDIAKREYPQDEKRSLNICTDPDDRAFINAAYAEGKALAAGAVNYINTGGPASAAVYDAYFGATQVGRIITALNNIANEDDPTRTLACADPRNACKDEPGGSVVAYTLITEENGNTVGSDIFFCPLFFQFVPSGNLCTGTPVDPPRIRGGTVVHELTHALEITPLNPDIYGCAASMALSDEASVLNADSYNCFVTQAYVNTHCPPA